MGYRLGDPAMNPSLSDFIERVTFGGILLGILLYQTHAQFRHRQARILLTIIGGVCLLVLIHLPRMDSVVAYVGPREGPDVRLDSGAGMLAHR